MSKHALRGGGLMSKVEYVELRVYAKADGRFVAFGAVNKGASERVNVEAEALTVADALEALVIKLGIV